MSSSTESSDGEQALGNSPLVSAQNQDTAEALALDRAPEQARPVSPALLPPWLTVELGLYALVLLLAAGLRLAGLGDAVLSPSEAERALAAWNVVHGQGADLSHGSALVYGLSALFFLLGANDTVARLLPALAGISIVVFPFALRGYLGRSAALCVALMLAVSPPLVHASRLVAGESPALALAAVAVAGWLAFRRWGQPEAMACVGAAGALALAVGPAGPSLWPLALVAGLAAWLWARRRGWIPIPARVARVAGATAAVVLLAVATGLWSSPSGVQRGLVDAAAGWRDGPGVPSLFFLTGVPLYEPASLLLGLLAVLSGGRRAVHAGLALLAAAAVVFAYTAFGMARPEALAVVAAPLALAGGLGLAVVWETVMAREGRGEAAVFAALAWPAVGLFVVEMGYVSLGLTTAGPLLVLAPIAFLASLAALWTQWRGRVAATRGVGLLLASVLLASALHISALLSTASSPARFEPVRVEDVSRDLRSLLAEVEDHTAVWATPRRRDLTLSVAPSIRQPLAWYLREYTRVTFGEPSGKPRLVIATPEQKAPGAEYRFQRYTWRMWSEYLPSTPAPFWRWWMYRDSPGNANHQEALLYVAVQGAN